MMDSLMLLHFSRSSILRNEQDSVELCCIVGSAPLRASTRTLQLCRRQVFAVTQPFMSRRALPRRPHISWGDEIFPSRGWEVWESHEFQLFFMENHAFHVCIAARARFSTPVRKAVVILGGQKSAVVAFAVRAFLFFIILLACFSSSSSIKSFPSIVFLALNFYA